MAAAEPEAWKTLDEFVGVDEIKDRFKTILTMAKYRDERRRRGLKTGDTSLNMVLEGPPGAGKTETAKVIGRALFEAGVHPGRNGEPVFINTSPAALKGQFVGESEAKMAEAFESAKGGVLFIDEANAWMSPDNKYGVAAMETLMKLTSDNPNDVQVILAGYQGTEETMGLREGLAVVNPGLPRRFPELVTYRDLKPKEKTQLSIQALKKEDYKVTPAARKRLAQAMEAMPGQGGDIMNFNALIKESISNRYGRAKKPEGFDFETVKPADVAYAIKRYRDEFNEPLIMPEG